MLSLVSLRCPFVLLENRLKHEQPARLYSEPQSIIQCDTPAEVPGAFEAIARALAHGAHVAGFVSYELGYSLEPKLAPLMPNQHDLPLLWFGVFAPPRVLPQPVVDDAFTALGPPPPLTDVQPTLDRSTYNKKFEQALDAIHAGDIYQLNLTFPLNFRYGGDPLALYGSLRAHQPVAHGGVVALSDTTILSVSPELFLEVEGRRIVTRPMKGTAARGVTSDADLMAKRNLRDDQKQQAENLMIVDLLRNDLSR